MEKENTDIENEENTDIEKEEIGEENTDIENEEIKEEYITFEVETREGTAVELAVIDEFEFEKKNYVAAALVKGDEIDDENLYIYKLKMNGDDFSVEKIVPQTEYQRVARAYMEM